MVGAPLIRDITQVHTHRHQLVVFCFQFTPCGLWRRFCPIVYGTRASQALGFTFPGWANLSHLAFARAHPCCMSVVLVAVKFSKFGVPSPSRSLASWLPSRYW